MLLELEEITYQDIKDLTIPDRKCEYTEHVSAIVSSIHNREQSIREFEFALTSLVRDPPEIGPLTTHN